jgi:hypothetical protein
VEDAVRPAVDRARRSEQLACDEKPPRVLR